MSKKMIIIGAALGLVVAGAAIAHFLAQQEAEERIEDLVYSSDFFENTEYGDVSYNIFTGTTTVNDVYMDIDEEWSRIESIDILSANFEDGVDLRIAINKATSDLVEKFRHTRSTNDRYDNDAIELVAMGQREIVTSLNIDLQYDPDDEAVTLDFSFDSNNIGAGQGKIELTNITEKLFEQVTGTIETQLVGAEKLGDLAARQALEILEGASRASVASIEIEIDASIAADRETKYSLVKKGYEINSDSMQRYREESFPADRAQLEKRLADYNVPPRKIKEWLKDISPESTSIKITSNAKRPVRITKLVDPDLSNLIKLLNLDVEF